MTPNAHSLLISANHRAESGLALILVLWILSLMSVIATSFVLSTRTDTILAGNTLSMATAEALADAGIHRAIYALATPSSNPLRWKGDGRAHVWTYQNKSIVITIRDEAAKIDINSASDALLRGLFRSAGLDEDSASRMLDRVLDWRDEDSLRRLNGAEADDYAAAGLAYRPSNARFRTVGELRQVLGMTEDVYRRLADAITVYSGLSGINSLIAPKAVLLALPGVDPVQVDAYIASRDVPEGIQVPVFAPAMAFQAGDSKVFSIRAEVKLEDGALFLREAIVRLGQGPGQAVSFLAWRAPDATGPAFGIEAHEGKDAP